MIVTASSDFHGNLPKPNTLQQTDLFAIAGDISPLEYQTSPSLLEDWLDTIFCDWAAQVPATKIVITPGNHDFCFTEDVFPENFIRILMKRNLEAKVILLINESMVFDGKRIFGCPYSDISNWAYSTWPTSQGFKADEHGYEKIEGDLDLLIVHQAPNFEDLGTSLQTSKRNFGSDKLLKVILNRKPKYVVCGHIHSGNHKPVNCNGITMRNVSYLDERYLPSYEPTTFVI